MTVRGFVAHLGPAAGAPDLTQTLCKGMLAMAGPAGGGGDPPVHTASLSLNGPFAFAAVAAMGGGEGEVIGTHDSGVVVIADAAIYYREDLLRRLRGRRVRPRTLGSADLIAAAVHAFRSRAPNLLEGDFAFAAWDPGEERLLLGRDPFGLRALFVRHVGGGLTLATHPGGAAAMVGSGTTHRWNREGVLRSVLFRPGSGQHTPLEGVREFPAGALATLPHPGAEVWPRRYWDAAPDPDLARIPRGEAVEVLGHLVMRASTERVVPGRTALALSGGQDSTAVLGGIRDTRSPHSSEPVKLLSLGYPKGDRGDERMYIEAVSAYMCLPVRWLDTGTIPLFEGMAARSRTWTHAFGHSFEGQNRALARAALEEGADVLLTGHGGDNVFFVSDDVMMADLLLSGRWGRLARAFRARGYAGARHFQRYCLRPALAPELVASVGGALGRAPLAWPGERIAPPWVSGDQGSVHELLRESRLRFQEDFHAPHRSRTGASRAWMILDPLYTQVTTNLHAMVRSEGVDLRAPLLDRRLVEFALSRPAPDFNQPGEGKVLLREAMRGRLPDLLVDPRPSRYKTGVPTEYFGRRFPGEVKAWVAGLSSSAWHLAELGVVDPESLAHLLGSPDEELAAWNFDLVCTLSTEQWLRSMTASNLHPL
jgi:asparagine synthase (glutamine-hydrolysing)